MTPLCCSLDDAISVFEKYSRYITHGEIDRIGVFDNFYVVETLNAYLFLLSLNDAPKPIDLGYALGFEEIPDFIKKYGLKKARGYYIPLNTLVLLVAPKKNCEGELRIKIPKKERMSFTDPIQDSLYAILDTAKGYLRYREKIIGCLSIACVSPLAEIAIEELVKRFKAASFEALDDKRISTKWRVRFEFGVRPLYVNEALLDIEKLEYDLANSYLILAEEEEVIRGALLGLEYDREEYLVKYFVGEEKSYGKIIVYKISLLKGEARVILAKNISNAETLEEMVGDNTLRVLLCLISNLKEITINNEKISCHKVKEKKREIKKTFLKNLREKIQQEMGVEIENEFKISFKGVKGLGFIAKRNNVIILAFQR
ncbi:MAG: hypothetical protein ACTSX9_09380 [Candidatus Njordarchaeales archaeon]